MGRHKGLKNKGLRCRFFGQFVLKKYQESFLGSECASRLWEGELEFLDRRFSELIIGGKAEFRILEKPCGGLEISDCQIERM